jgi:hypothetical protein
MARLVLVLAFAASALASGCAPAIGDGCASATNCSVNGDRQCDLTQPGGACTVFDCQADQCPDSAVCVRFNPDDPRHSVVACMKACTDDGSCRGEYECVRATDLGVMPDGDDFARVLDVSRGDRSFCIARD